MKALSIRQPWCWCILNLGKDIENRSWKPGNPGLRFRGEFLIHASAGMTRDEYEDCLATVHHISLSHPFTPGMVFPSFEELQRGGIVGQAELVAIVDAHPSPWFFGEKGLVLRNARAIPFRPMKGQLGFFEVPEE